MRLNQQKDIFIFQCFTGFRIGDLNRFNRDWVAEDRIVTLAEKTKTRITIPILDEAREILLKYNYKLPVISDNNYNLAIHQFLKEFEFNRVIQEKESKPLHEVATSHTARKSLITYAHSKLRLSVADISLISGTSKETIMKYYIGANIDDIESKLKSRE